MPLAYRIQVCFVLMIFIFFPLPHIHAAETDNTLINSFEEDITGDGFHEYIRLQGKQIKENSSFYQNVWLDMEDSFHKKWSIYLKNGYEPSLTFIDFNHDQVFDLFYQVRKEMDQPYYDYQLYTLKNGKPETLELPERHTIQGSFTDGFQVQIHVQGEQKPYQLDIGHLKKQYMDQALYDEKGALLKEQDVTVQPITSLEPILISESKGYGLKSTQFIKGMDGSETIGRVESLWYYKNKQWIALQTKVTPS